MHVALRVFPVGSVAAEGNPESQKPEQQPKQKHGNSNSNSNPSRPAWPAVFAGSGSDGRFCYCGKSAFTAGAHLVRDEALP